MPFRVRKVLKSCVGVSCFIVLGALGGSQANAQAPKTGELLVNPGFEDLKEDKIVGWGPIPYAIITSPLQFVSGDRSIEIASSKAGYEPHIVQHVRDFEVGAKYRFQYWVRGSAAEQGYRAYIGIWDNTKPKMIWKKLDDIIGEWHPDPSAGPWKWIDGANTEWKTVGTQWQKVSFEFEAKAPSDMLMIVLQGKGPGTVWFDDVSLRKSSEPDTSANAVVRPSTRITEDLRFVANGRPFFPIQINGWYPETEAAMRKAREWGFNCISTMEVDVNGAEATRLWLDAARRQDLMVQVQTHFGYETAAVPNVMPAKLKAVREAVEAVRDHPANLYYIVADEPAWGKHDVKAYAEGIKLIKELDPHHPVVVNHAPRNTIEELNAYNQYIDVTGSDVYPVWRAGKDFHSDLPNDTLSVVGDEVIKNLKAVDYKKPVIETLQAFAWSETRAKPDDHSEPFPDQKQLRFMAYDAIVAGATGLVFFQDWRYDDLRPELKPIATELNAMSDVLAAAKILPVEGVQKSPEIRMITREYNGQLLIFAVNTASKPVNATFNLAQYKIAPQTLQLRVLQESRNVALRNGILTDSFEPFSVHIYATAKQDDQLKRSAAR